MTVKQLWIEACKFDGIDPDNAMFCVFSNANPWAAKYNTAMGLALAWAKQQARKSRPSLHTLSQYGDFLT
jgi:hypothetical protein